jgi:hypothetical protein
MSCPGRAQRKGSLPGNNAKRPAFWRPSRLILDITATPGQALDRARRVWVLPPGPAELPGAIAPKPGLLVLFDHFAPGRAGHEVGFLL